MNTEIQIAKEESESKGRLVAKKNGEEIGEMTYSKANNGELLIVDHTGVEDAHKEEGVGKALFFRMVDLAREDKRKIMPLCPFVKAMFKKNKDLWDVLRHESL
ncbi:MAG: GNAT family N-acetyltransferase [Cyclobacteriaceae bacterium]